MGDRAAKEPVKLTDAKVKALKPSESMTRLWDTVVPGFHVRVYPTGAKSYAVQFQRPDGTKVQVTIGAAGVFSAEGAREKAKKLREIHDVGQDARAYMLEKRNAKDVSALVKLWEKDYKSKLKPSSRASYSSIIKCIILPALGRRLVKDLDRPTIKALYKKEAKENPIGANRMITVLSRLMNIAEEETWKPLGSNPCIRFPKGKEKPCPRVLTASELGRLEAAMANLEAIGKLDGVAADLIRFLALSGLRSGEAAKLKWTDINLDRNKMYIRDHKTDATMGDKVLPLNSCLKVILHRRAGNRLGHLVFPGLASERPIQGLRKMWLRVLAVEGCNLEDVTPHDLRRTFMTVTVELGYPPAVGDTLLGHSLGKIRDTYMRLSMDGILSAASEDAACWIQAAMAGEAPQPGAKVKSSDGQTANA